MPPKPAVIRFYCDADVQLLGRVLVQVRSDVTYPGDPGGPAIDKRLRPACPITSPATDDSDWIAEVARRGWIAITRDSAITRRPGEIDAVRSHGARLVILSGREARTTFEQLEIVMTRWRAIEALLDEPGPFAYAATRTTFRPVDLS